MLDAVKIARRESRRLFAQSASVKAARVRRAGYALVALLMAQPAFAHTSGNSECELTVQQDGLVNGRIAIAARELSALAPVDADGDGRIEPSEMETQRPYFEKLANGLLEVQADGVICPAHLANMVLGDQYDGIDFFIEYRCPASPREIEVQALLVSALPLSHRHALTLRAGAVIERAALGGPARRATIHTPFVAGRRSAAWLTLAALILGLIVVAVRRQRASG